MKVWTVSIIGQVDGVTVSAVHYVFSTEALADAWTREHPAAWGHYLTEEWDVDEATQRQGEGER